MLLSRFILLVLLLQSGTCILAQVTGREKNTGNRATTGDTTAALKKKIIHQYDSLISNCHFRILLLHRSIAGLEKQVEDLKQHSRQAAADHAAWEKSAARSLSKEQLAIQSLQKKQALREKIGENDKQIDGLLNQIGNKKKQVKKLQSGAAMLEKEKAAALSKLQ